MTHLKAQTFALIAALFVTTISLGAIVSVPAPNAAPFTTELA
ncbi:MAG: hypothetical protein AAGK02_13270 [Pseudomonadota bacterium]